jgi:hypothetical protein
MVGLSDAALVIISLVSLIDDDKYYVVNAQVVVMDEPANGIIAMDLSDADDVDIDANPPQGVSIIVTNSTHGDK